jgi:D-3-phosphoglycerate dehydrogenase
MATQAQDILPSPGRLTNTVSQGLSVSTSPTATFQSPLSGSHNTGSHLAARTLPAAKQLKPFDTQDIKILLLENVNQSGRDILLAQGYQVEALKTSLPEDQLIEKIR